MLPQPTLITASFVARQIGYRMPQGWMQGDDATNAWFAPLARFAGRFDALLAEIKALGYSGIDLWCAHLHWRWATLHHVETARTLLAKHQLAVRSYPAWVMGDAEDLRAACRLCAALDIPFFAGNCALFAADRAAAVAIFREFGVGYAIENHPEKSAAEIFARLGDGDEDVVGVALDTGWCATAQWDPVQAAKDFGGRLMAVHLKDVCAPRAEKTGLEFIDRGHETCRLGDGIARVREVLAELKRQGFRGSIGIEHEPELFDPASDLAESRTRVLSWWTETQVREPAPPLRVAVVGCGNISQAYGAALAESASIRIQGACDVDAARSAGFVEKLGGRCYRTLAEALADPEVEAIVNLTIQNAHVAVVTQALEAGKHVHSEKPLAPTAAEAKTLVDLAARKGVRLSCAPVTWLGEAQQTAWKWVREGKIGTPRVAYAAVDWARIETWHPNPVPFYAVGPVFDVAVYPIALLTAWFGPVRRVLAGGAILLPHRTTPDGKTFTVTTEDWTLALLEFAQGLRARVTANFYVSDPAGQRPALDLHGDLGSISTEWFAATARVRHGKFGGRYQTVPKLRPCAGTGEWWVDWSAGVVGLWRGLRTGQPHPTGGEHAAHVVEVMEAVHASIRLQRPVDIASVFPAPRPQRWAE